MNAVKHVIRSGESPIRGWRLPLLFVLLAGAALRPAQATAVHKLVSGSSFCDGTGTSAAGEGSTSQVGVHADVFLPAFSSICPDVATPTYQGTGDSNAVTKLYDRTRDFTASDVPLTTSEKVIVENDLAALRNRRSLIHQMPLYIDALAVGYNLSESCIPSTTTLKLRSQVLSQILWGNIEFWDDDLLVLDNPTLENCHAPISLVRRTGYAGATAILKDYLSKRNPEWNYYKQAAQNQEWPGDGNTVCLGLNDQGMANCINSTSGTLGYLQYRVAKTGGVRMAALDNPVSAVSTDASKRFISPSPTQCVNAAKTAVTLPGIDPVDLGSFSVEPPPPTQGDWSAISLTDAPDGYPVCNFGYVFVFGRWFGAYGGQNQVGNARTVVDYLWVAVMSDTQATLLSQDYAPLPDGLLHAVRLGIESIRMF